MSEMGTVVSGDLGSSKKRYGSATLRPCNSSTSSSRRVSGYSMDDILVSNSKNGTGRGI